MAEEVENYLLQKLRKAIEQQGAEQFGYLSRKLYSLNDFEALKETIQNRTGLAADECWRRETLHHLHNLLAEWQLIVKKHGMYYPEALRTSYKLSESLKKFKRDLNSSPTDHPAQAPATPIFPDNFETYRWSSRYPPKKVYGLDHNKKLMERLLVRKEGSERFKGIAIVGIPGVGKTALCQVMFNHQAVKQHFDLRIWVCLSKQKTDEHDFRKEAVKRMLTCLGVEHEAIELVGQEENGGLQTLIHALRQQLSKAKKYLIVLDDVWSEDNFFENLSSDSTNEQQQQQQQQQLLQLAYGLPKVEGSTVLITARSEKVAKKVVGDCNVHHLPLLKKEELCWEIFKDTVTKRGRTDLLPRHQDVEALKDLVVKKCGGLPLSATMMGEIMRINWVEEERMKKAEQIKAQKQQQKKKQKQTPTAK